MRKLALLASLIAVLAIDAASAQAQTYGMAGCGLGALVFKNDPDVVKQVVAATLNGTGYQTFGISTGTSECQPAGRARRAALFIEVNREALAKDVARGAGETVENFSAVVGCTDPNALAASLRQNFKAVFQPVSTDTLTDTILETIQQDPVLASSCSVS